MLDVVQMSDHNKSTNQYYNLLLIRYKFKSSARQRGSMR